MSLKRQLNLNLKGIFVAIDIPKPHQIVKPQSHQAPLLLDPENTADRSIVVAYPHNFIIWQINGGNIPCRHSYKQNAVLVDIAAQYRMLQEHLPQFLHLSAAARAWPQLIIPDVAIPRTGEEGRLLAVNIPNQAAHCIQRLIFISYPNLASVWRIIVSAAVVVHCYFKLILQASYKSQRSLKVVNYANII